MKTIRSTHRVEEAMGLIESEIESVCGFTGSIEGMAYPLSRALDNLSSYVIEYKEVSQYHHEGGNVKEKKEDVKTRNGKMFLRTPIPKKPHKEDRVIAAMDKKTQLYLCVTEYSGYDVFCECSYDYKRGWDLPDGVINFEQNQDTNEFQLWEMQHMEVDKGLVGIHIAEGVTKKEALKALARLICRVEDLSWKRFPESEPELGDEQEMPF